MPRKKKETSQEIEAEDLEQFFDEIKGYRGNENLPIHAKIEWTKERVDDYRKCRNSIFQFSKHFWIINMDDGRMPIKLRDYQKRMLKALTENRKVIFLSSRQIGKALSIDTPISTPNGFTTMGELKDGDIVFDENGNETKVIKAHDILYNRKCYEMEFSTGEKIIADSEHLWKTQSANERKTNKSASIKTSEEIYNSIKTGGKKPFSNHRIKKAECLNYHKKDLLIDPYILGYWLGDGNAADGRITVGTQDFKEVLNIFNNIESIDRIESSFYDYRNIHSARIKLKGEISLYSKLKNLNLIKNKHIPKIYLESSEEQRKELLRGLMDSDGYVCKKGSFEISLSDRKLIDDVKSLVSSLGLTITERVKKTTHKDSIAIRFRSFFDCCKLPRKLERCKITSDHKEEKLRYSDYIYITGMKEVDSVPVRCITVDSPSSLFLCGKTLIPTHNTTVVSIFALWLICFNADQRILLVANKKDTALEIFQNIKFAYEQLPLHIKPSLGDSGKFNETKISFENGSSIKIAATSEDAFRGQSANCILLDEFAFVEPGVVDAFFSSVFPVISSSKKGRTIVLSTPNGKNKFYELWEEAERKKNGFHPERIDWWEVPGRDEAWAEEQKSVMGKKMFDQEYGNEFLDDSKDVVDKELLDKMRTVAVEIEKKKEFQQFEDEFNGIYKIFNPYEKDHFYTIGVDTAEGIGQDNSCIQILDISDLNEIKQSAVYTSDRIQPEEYARKVNEIARMWGTPPLMVESNNVGNVVVKSLLKNFRYPHVPSYIAKQGNQSTGKLGQPGLWMTTNSKSNAVFNMRHYMNNLKVLRLFDVETIDEFATFQRGSNGMWGKKKGDKYKDDRVDAVYLALMILLDDICSKYYSIEDRDAAGKPLVLMPMGGWHVPSKLSNNEFRQNLRNPNYGYGESSYHKYNFAPALIGGVNQNRFEKNYELEYNMATSGYFSKNGVYTENDYEKARQMYGEDVESLQEEGWEIVNF